MKINNIEFSNISSKELAETRTDEQTDIIFPQKLDNSENIYYFMRDKNGEESYFTGPESFVSEGEVYCRSAAKISCVSAGVEYEEEEDFAIYPTDLFCKTERGDLFTRWEYLKECFDAIL